MKEVAPGIFMVTERLKGRLFRFSVNVFVLAGPDGLVFDSGFGRRDASGHLLGCLEKIRTVMRGRGEGCDIRRVLLSHGHWDHFSGLASLHKEAGMKVLLTKRMRETIRTKSAYRRSYRTGPRRTGRGRFMDTCAGIGEALLDGLFFRQSGVLFYDGPVETLPENTTLTVNGEAWRMMHAPGHCDDHIVLYSEKRGILLGGDNVLGKITTWLGPPRSSLDGYLETLARIRALPNLRLILGAHGSPVTNPVERIDRMIAHRNERTETVRGLVKRSGEKGVTLKALLGRLYARQGFYQRYMARGWVELTLAHLVAKGLLVEKQARGVSRFVWAGPQDG